MFSDFSLFKLTRNENRIIKAQSYNDIKLKIEIKTENKETQTEDPSKISEYRSTYNISNINITTLQKFLEKTSYFIDEALKDSQNKDFQELYHQSELLNQKNLNISFESITVFNPLSILNKYEIDITNEKANFKISDYALYGNYILIGYYIDSHILPCNHISYLSIFEISDSLLSNVNSYLSNNQKGRQQSIQNDVSYKTIEVDSCISCIIPFASSSIPNQIDFLIGTYLGDILHIIYKKSDSLLEINKPTQSGFKHHHEKVCNIKYIDSHNKIISISSNGIMYIWNYDREIKYIKRVNEIEVSNILLYPYIGYNLKYKVNKLKAPQQIHPTSIIETSIFSSSNLKVNKTIFNKSTFIIIGCLDGNMYRSRIDYSGNMSNEKIFDLGNKGSNSNSHNLIWERGLKSLIFNMKNEDAIEIKTLLEKMVSISESKEVKLSSIANLNIDITKYYKNNIEFNFERNFSCINCLSSSKLTRPDMFISISNDGIFRLYDQNGKYLKVNFFSDPNEIFTFAVFSEFIPNLIFSSTNKGRIIAYLLTKSEDSNLNANLKEVSIFEGSVKGSSICLIKEGRVKLDFNKRIIGEVNVLYIGYISGVVEMIRYSDD